MFSPYRGNAPKAVNKDAKYSVTHQGDGMVVRLIYRLNDQERALLTTDRHSDLVRVVNQVKEEKNGQPGGRPEEIGPWGLVQLHRILLSHLDNQPPPERCVNGATVLAGDRYE